jgi:hypothetical protein
VVNVFHQTLQYRVDFGSLCIRAAFEGYREGCTAKSASDEGAEKRQCVSVD